MRLPLLRALITSAWLLCPDRWAFTDKADPLEHLIYESLRRAVIDSERLTDQIRKSRMVHP